MTSFGPGDHRRPAPAYEHVEQLLREAQRLTAGLGGRWAAAVARDVEDLADGYPSGGGLAAGGRGGGGYADPVADLVERRVDNEREFLARAAEDPRLDPTDAGEHDPLRQVLRRAGRHVLRGVEALRDAEGELGRLERSSTSDSRGDPGCPVCARAGIFSRPRHAAGRRWCRACEDLASRLGRQPTAEEVREREAGRVEREVRRRAA